MPHFVYMLRCKGNCIYTGYAVDVQARFQQHIAGKGAKFTKAFPPECILRTFEFEDYKYALRMEARIKKLTKRQKELLALGSSEIECSLLSGLNKTLPKKRQSSKRSALK